MPSSKSRDSYFFEQKNKCLSLNLVNYGNCHLFFFHLFSLFLSSCQLLSTCQVVHSNSKKYIQQCILNSKVKGTNKGIQINKYCALTNLNEYFLFLMVVYYVAVFHQFITRLQIIMPIVNLFTFSTVPYFLT